MQAPRVFVALVLCSTISVSVAESQQVREIYKTVDDNGREQVYRVVESKLLATKRWSPESEPPPLSVSAAVAAALTRVAKKPDGLRVTRIELIASGGEEWRWFYLVAIYDTTKGKGPKPPEMREIVVLMDGSVVEPATPRSSP